MNMEDPVTRQDRDGVAVLTLNQPETHNALSIELVNRLGDFLEDCRYDPEVRVVEITNAGTTFCAGAHLKADTPSGAERRHKVVDVIAAIASYPKPTIARVDGHCVAGGIGIVAACDFSIVREDTRLGFTEVRIGVAPAIVAVVCLPKLSRAHAAELFLTGKRIDAARAAEVGLITRAVPSSELDATVEAIIDDLLEGGPSALGAIKELVNVIPSMRRDAAFEWAAELSARLFASEEARSGIEAFRQKRPAPWSRRAQA